MTFILIAILIKCYNRYRELFLFYQILSKTYTYINCTIGWTEVSLQRRYKQPFSTKVPNIFCYWFREIICCYISTTFRNIWRLDLIILPAVLPWTPEIFDYIFLDIKGWDEQVCLMVSEIPNRNNTLSHRTCLAQRIQWTNMSFL